MLDAALPISGNQYLNWAAEETELKERGPNERKPHEPHRVRLPGFLIEEEKEIGLGDIVKRVTTAFGIKPCGGCERRAAALNRWVVFTGRVR
jgi:hypothetical protein